MHPIVSWTFLKLDEDSLLRKLNLFHISLEFWKCPEKILPHFESDYGAAPKVSLPINKEVTFFNPEYSTNRWLGFKGNIKSNPHLDSCTSQQIVEIQGDWKKLKSEARDSHWVMAFGDYLKEGEYAARRIGVKWEDIL